MQCPKCNAENEDGTTVCKACGEPLEVSYPRALFLDQVPRGDRGAPTNVPLETMAFLMLGRRYAKWVLITLLATLLFGFLTAVFLTR